MAIMFNLNIFYTTVRLYTQLNKQLLKSYKFLVKLLLYHHFKLFPTKEQYKNKTNKIQTLKIFASHPTPSALVFIDTIQSIFTLFSFDHNIKHYHYFFTMHRRMDQKWK